MMGDILTPKRKDRARRAARGVLLALLCACLLAGCGSPKVVPLIEEETLPAASPSPAPEEGGAQAEVAGPERQTRTMYVAQDHHGFRKEPAYAAEVIRFLSIGDRVELYRVDGIWAEVSLNGTDGYLVADCLTEQPPAMASPTDSQALSATPDAAPSPAKKIVAIDAGHQEKGNNGKEPVGPGASEVKPKVASGTAGVSTKVPEYKLTLAVSLKLRDELLARGYDVLMIRETNDVDISNIERAQMAADGGADIFVRVHANGSTDQSAHGMLMVSPTKDSPYVAHLYDESLRLARCLLDEMVEASGANRRGIWETDSMSGINWSTMPVVLVEMGYMTNPAEDEKMQTEDYQALLATAMADGIDRYFAEE